MPLFWPCMPRLLWYRWTAFPSFNFVKVISANFVDCNSRLLIWSSVSSLIQFPPVIRPWQWAPPILHHLMVLSNLVHGLRLAFPCSDVSCLATISDHHDILVFFDALVFHKIDFPEGFLFVTSEVLCKSGPGNTAWYVEVNILNTLSVSLRLAWSAFKSVSLFHFSKVCDNAHFFFSDESVACKLILRVTRLFDFTLLQQFLNFVLS